MKISRWLLPLLGVFSAVGAEEAPMRQVATIPLPKVEGRIDHLAVDTARQRLFVAALGNGSLEVVDFDKGAVVKHIGGLREPQGVVYAAGLDKLFVACGGDGMFKIFDGGSLELVKDVQLGEDADNVRYDEKTRRVYVGDVGLAILDAPTGKRLGDIKLMAHPESFQLESRSPRIFVNVARDGLVAVVDRDKRAVVARWPLGEARANFPMALDEAGRRLFVGCRKPPRLVVLDTTSGKIMASLPIDGDADDLFFDAARRRIYISCGVGLLDVLRQTDADHYAMAAKIPTAAGARTSLLVPALNRFYLAVPHRGEQPAEIRVYELP